MKKQWVIIGQTDGYHASKYRHKTGGREKWVETREYCTEEHMSAKLMQWLEQEGGDNYNIETEASIAALAADGEDVSWYEGEGVYCERNQVMAKGALWYRHDIWYYEAVPADEFDEEELNA